MKYILESDFDKTYEELSLEFYDFANPETYKHLAGKSGIYLIRNKNTGQMYIGQARDLYERLRKHLVRCLSDSITHRDSPKLHNAIKKYGPDNFEVAILEFTNDVDNAERYWIGKYNTYKDKSNYNLTPGGQDAKTHGKEVAKYNKDGTLLATYDSIADAAWDLYNTGYIAQARSKDEEGTLVYPSSPETVRKKISDALNSNSQRATPYGFVWKLIEKEE